MPVPRRRSWLDWQRGLAVLCMIEVHALDAWLLPGLPRTTVHDVLWMIGGFAAPGFLYLAGLSQSLAARRDAERALDGRARLIAALRRAGVVLAAAYGFRLLEYVLGGTWRVPGGWHGLFKVDILNVIAVGLVGSALLGALCRRRRVGAAAAAAIAVALATPPVAAWSGGPAWLAPWSYARGDTAAFALFPWAAFLFAGAAAGDVLARHERPRGFVLLGAGLFGAAALADRFGTFYAFQDFWHSSPAWVVMRLGILLAATGALQLLPADVPLRPLAALGRHSLLAYVLSVELTYGLAARPLAHALSTGGVLAGAAALTLLTWAVAERIDRRAARKQAPAPSAAGLQSTP